MPRPMTRQERILARHWLQELSEQAKVVRDAVHPNYGVHTVTDIQWEEQWLTLRKNLDGFTADVMAGRTPASIKGIDYDPST